MSKFDSLQDRALELAGQVGDGLRHALPDQASKWLQTGVVLGAARTGAKSAGKLVRRNPGLLTIAVVAAAGAGLLLYAARRRRERAAGQQGAAIEGRSKRVQAKRAPRARKSTARGSARARRDAGSAD